MQLSLLLYFFYHSNLSFMLAKVCFTISFDKAKNPTKEVESVPAEPPIEEVLPLQNKLLNRLKVL